MLDLNLGSAFDAPVTVNLAPWSYQSLQVVQNDGNLVKAADVLSPLDKQASVKITNTKIANVYNTLAKGQIPIGNQSSNSSGQSIFVELNATASKTVGSTEVLLPVVARIEVRLPNDGELTNADVVTLVMACFATMHDGMGVPRVTDMMRGVLLPD